MYRERPAHAPGVRCLWTQAHCVPYTQRVVPDGCVDVVWSPRGIFVAGPDTRPWLAAIAPGERLYGVRFAPGQARLGLPMQEVRDARPFLEQLRRDADELAERVAEAADPEAELERLVAPGVIDHRSAAIVRALGQDPLGGWPGMRAVADRLGLGERQLHRRCTERFGYGPKTLQRILRFQRALRAARSGSDFATVAHASGFADQPHLARDVRDLGGVPLSELAPARDRAS